MFAVDTNVLVYAARRRHRSRNLVTFRISKLAEGRLKEIEREKVRPIKIFSDEEMDSYGVADQREAQ